jgi:phage gp45-like
MKIADIDKLKRNEENENLFNLTTVTFQATWQGVNYNSYRVKKGEEMRIDLVCNSIYGNIDHVDIILSVNNISNPLNIKEGTTIIYPNIEQIEKLRPQEVAVENTQKLLANKDKSTKVDPSRQAYVEQNFNLPPTVMDTPTQQIKVAGNNIRVGTGLFNK